SLGLADQKQFESMSKQEKGGDLFGLFKVTLKGVCETVTNSREPAAVTDYNRGNRHLTLQDNVFRSFVAVGNFEQTVGKYVEPTQDLNQECVLTEQAQQEYDFSDLTNELGKSQIWKGKVWLEYYGYEKKIRSKQIRDTKKGRRRRKPQRLTLYEHYEPKQNLRNLILQIQTTITDPEKVQGRLNKEDKNISLKACQAKSDWLENTKEATMQDFVEQKQLLEDIMLPIFTKLATPRDENCNTNGSSGHLQEL
ncbi:Hypothetical predicted protein, partial [Podarcis lilfordi]